jgi:hypothetical protein
MRFLRHRRANEWLPIQLANHAWKATGSASTFRREGIIRRFAEFQSFICPAMPQKTPVESTTGLGFCRGSFFETPR